MDDLRYPLGRFRYDPEVNDASRAASIDAIAAAPAALRAAVADLDEGQLATPYRPDGWTVRQLVHHVADSHINAYIRFRLALTEDDPPFKPYAEKEWAKLPDAVATPVQASLRLLDGLHERWVRLLRATPAEAMARTGQHPDHGAISVDYLLQMYAWHGRHHVAHVTALRRRENW